MMRGRGADDVGGVHYYHVLTTLLAAEDIDMLCMLEWGRRVVC